MESGAEVGTETEPEIEFGTETEARIEPERGKR